MNFKYEIKIYNINLILYEILNIFYYSFIFYIDFYFIMIFILK